MSGDHNVSATGLGVQNCAEGTPGTDALETRGDANGHVYLHVTRDSNRFEGGILKRLVNIFNQNPIIIEKGDILTTIHKGHGLTTVRTLIKAEHLKEDNPEFSTITAILTRPNDTTASEHLHNLAELGYGNGISAQTTRSIIQHHNFNITKDSIKKYKDNPGALISMLQYSDFKGPENIETIYTALSELEGNEKATVFNLVRNANAPTNPSHRLPSCMILKRMILKADEADEAELAELAAAETDLKKAEADATALKTAVKTTATASELAEADAKAKRETASTTALIAETPAADEAEETPAPETVEVREAKAAADEAETVAVDKKSTAKTMAARAAAADAKVTAAKERVTAAKADIDQSFTDPQFKGILDYVINDTIPAEATENRKNERTDILLILIRNPKTTKAQRTKISNLVPEEGEGSKLFSDANIDSIREALNPPPAPAPAPAPATAEAIIPQHLPLFRK